MCSTSEEGSHTRKGNSELSEGERLLRQAGRTLTTDQAMLRASPMSSLPIFPGISAPLNTDSQTEQSHPNRSNQARYSLQMGGWKDCGVFPIITQNFLQNLFCLSKNQAHVATSIRFEHPRGHRAGACLICRAVSLPRAPQALRSPSC